MEDITNEEQPQESLGKWTLKLVAWIMAALLIFVGASIVTGKILTEERPSRQEQLKTQIEEENQSLQEERKTTAS
jgi:hypothetical protein